MGRLIEWQNPRIELMKKEIINFFEVRLSSNYQPKLNEPLTYKGENFQYEYTTSEFLNFYVPTENLTLLELEEVIQYILHYGYTNTNEKGEEVPEYRGRLEDWDGISIAHNNVILRELIDVDGTFKSNKEGIGRCSLSDDDKLNILQRITIACSKKCDTFDDKFYARCIRIHESFIDKYENTNFSLLGITINQAIDKYCDLVKDAKIKYLGVHKDDNINDVGVYELTYYKS